MSNNQPTNWGNFSGGGGGNSFKNLGGNVTYTSPPVQITPNTSAHAFVNRTGALNNFSNNTGSNTVGVGFKFRF
jgi:hypothetical protein